MLRETSTASTSSMSTGTVLPGAVPDCAAASVGIASSAAHAKIMNPARQVRIQFAPVQTARESAHYPGIGRANARAIGGAIHPTAARGFIRARRSRMITRSIGGEPGMKQTKLSDTIAQAIRKADRRYFFE